MDAGFTRTMLFRSPCRREIRLNVLLAPVIDRVRIDLRSWYGIFWYRCERKSTLKHYEAVSVLLEDFQDTRGNVLPQTGILHCHQPQVCLPGFQRGGYNLADPNMRHVKNTQ
jgi:hypothetical protein